MFKNTVKLLLSNFSGAWKVFVYKLLVLGIVAGLFCTTLGYLNQLGAFSALKASVVSFLNIANFASAPADVMLGAGVVLESFGQFISELVTTFPVLFVYILVLLTLILPYLWHLGDLAASEGVFGFMSSQTKYGFCSSLIRNLNKANAYSWSVTAILLPFNLMFFSGIVGLEILSGLGGIWLVVGPALIIVWAIIYYSLRTIILSSWAGAITTTGSRTWPSFIHAFRAVGREFLIIWTSAIAFVFIFAMFGVLTGLIGCVIMLPLFCFIISIFGLVVFFEHRGMRYYVDFETIVTPKRLEQTDKLNKLKYLI